MKVPGTDPGFRHLRQLAALRGLTMIGYSMSYVVIPTLVFERTRSAAAAGLALIAEGLLRALLAVIAGRLRSLVGAGCVVHAAEACKLGALGLLALSLGQFSLAMVVSASILYQLGYSLSLLEQELRCGALESHVARGQAYYRMAEMLAVPPVLVTALVGQSLGIGLQTLIAGAVIASIVHHRLWHRWLQPMPAGSQLGLAALREAASYICTHQMMAGGMLASLIGYGFFSWVLLATPFAFEGRQLLGLALSSVGGNAGFKALAAAACMVGAFLWVRVFVLAAADRIMLLVSIAIPAVFLGAMSAGSDWVAVAAGCASVVMSTGLSSWQRAWRLRHAPERLRHGVTTLYLSTECLGMACAGAALLLDDATFACGCATACLVWGLRRFWAGGAAAASTIEVATGTERV